jgi:RNA 2',3'-cyclic 3'-phosphodiesterase
VARDATERVGPGELEAADGLTGAAKPAGPIRAFFALPLPDAQRTELGRYLAGCSNVAPQFRWVAYDNLHLTLRFLGQVDAEIAARIADAVKLQQPTQFEIALGELGSFGRGRTARVVWMGLSVGAAAARGLAALLEAECLKSGLEAEPRALQPHLTLARARSREGAELPAMPEPPILEPWIATELVLYRSHLKRAGAEYEPIARVGLRV